MEYCTLTNIEEIPSVASLLQGESLKTYNCGYVPYLRVEYGVKKTSHGEVLLNDVYLYNDENNDAFLIDIKMLSQNDYKALMTTVNLHIDENIGQILSDLEQANEYRDSNSDHI